MAKKKEKQDSKKLIRRLRNHYKLVVLNIDTFEERFSLLLTPINVIILSTISLTFIVLVTFALLGWTPLRYYLPGYAEEILIKRMAIESAIKADSMEVALEQRDLFIQNFQQIIEGRLEDTVTHISPEIKVDPTEVSFNRSKEDSMLRVEIEKEDLVNLIPDFNRDAKSSYLLFPPVKGTVTDRFNIQRKHYGVDIAAPKDASIKGSG